MTELGNLTEENLHLHAKLKDLENRLRCSNFCILGIPKTVIDLQATMATLSQEPIPSIRVKHLEFDWVHHALARQTSDSPSQGHYYQVSILPYEGEHLAGHLNPYISKDTPIKSSLFWLVPSFPDFRMGNKTSITDSLSQRIPYR